MARARLSPHLVSAAVLAADSASWRDAVRTACEPLVDAGAVEPRYADACVETIDANGPYIVVAPGVALAHARPEQGVRTLGLSVLVLSQPVPFGHPTNDPVDLVFAFGSPDRSQHTGLLSALSRALMGDLTGRLRGASSDAEAHELIQEVIDDVVDR